jgi:hypothetical protein
MLLEMKLKQMPDDAPVDMGSEITAYDGVMLALMKKGLEGDMNAVKEIQDTLYGKIKEEIKTEHSFKQMGQVKLEDTSGDVKEALTFDVGTELADIAVGEGDVLDE